MTGDKLHNGAENIRECSSTLYLGIAMEFMEIVGFDHSVIRPDKLPKAADRLHCLAVHQNTNKQSLEYVGGEKYRV